MKLTRVLAVALAVIGTQAIQLNGIEAETELNVGVSVATHPELLNLYVEDFEKNEEGPKFGKGASKLKHKDYCDEYFGCK